MNVADTERMDTLLQEGGMTPVESPDDADLIVINGCSVREKAVHKAVSYLGGTQWLKKKQAGTGPLLAVGGCVGSLEKEQLFKRAPYLDFVFGPDAIDQLPELVFRSARGERRILATEFDKTMSFSTKTKVSTRKAQAFVNIMKGCDKYCTYCIVPFTRGREKSRTISEVLDDLASLVAKGVREVTLLGQNVNSFGKGNKNTQGLLPLELHNRIGKVGPREGDENFPMLLRAIDADPRLQNLKWLRFTSSHPLDFSDELIDCYKPAADGGVSKLTPYLHLPVQSGSDRILQKMGRHHKIHDYKDQMKELRRLCPEVGLSTDLIVGFPGETEEDFQATVELLRELQYDHIYAFAYSVRPGTRAGKMVDDVPDSVKNERLNHLLTVQQEISSFRNQRRVGQRVQVLVESEAKNDGLLRNYPEDVRANAKVWSGKSGDFRTVHFVSFLPRSFQGQLCDVLIEGATALSLHGTLQSRAEDLL